MNTQFWIKNFRIFGPDNATIGFKPITILTGCNSSGKSSIVKSLLFLKEFFRKATDELIRTGEYRPAQYSVDFTLPELNLQSYKSAVNKKHPKKPIVLAFKAESLLFYFKVELSFVSKETDPFDRAWLQSMSIYSLSEELLLKAEVDRDVLRLKSLNLLNEEFNYEFLNAAYIANYLFVERKKSECIDLYGDIIDPEGYEMWEQERITYLDFLSKIPVYKNVFDDIVKEFDYEGFVNDFPRLSGQRDNYLVSIKKTGKHNLIFYFPVLDHLMDLDKEEVINKLSDIKFNDSLPLPFSVNNWGKMIADNFEKSRHENFIDYYRELENKELSDVMTTQVNNISLNRQEDFFGEVNSHASIRFDSNNNIHFFSTENNEVDFNKVYRFLSCWQWSEGLPDGNGIISGVVDSNGIQSRHILYDAMLEYLSFMLKKVLFPNFLNRLEYVGNFQSNVKRLYSFDDKSNNLGNTIYAFLELKSKLDSIHRVEASWNTLSNHIYTPGSFMDKWVKKLGIGTKVIIKEDVDGLGAKLYIRKKGERGNSPLADEGYGISQIITFLLHIENEILKNKLKEDRVKIRGTDGMNTYIDGTPVDETNELPTLAIEEPEVSLHPSMQSMLTDVFFDASKNYGIHFIVETHSEYLIRRSQAFIAQMSSKKEFEERPFAVHYVEKGGKTYELVYQESGRFENSFGPGFFDEAGRSSLQVLKREKRMKNEKNV